MSTGASSQWGRIDDDGTVVALTPDGERVVGSWQAGEAAAGLAYYERKFDDLATEIDLLAKRLESGAGDPQHTRARAVAVRDELPTASAIGDYAELTTQIEALLGKVEEKDAAASEAKKEARAASVAAKEKLAAEAEELAEKSTQWKAAGDRLRDIVEDWKKIRGIDRKTDEALWQRFATARDAFGKRRSQYFATLDKDRAAATEVKEKLIERAEELAKSDDWKDVSASMRGLMAEWKEAPRAARNLEDKLWGRFRAAQDSFFSRRSEELTARDSEHGENLAKKEAIIAEAESLDLSEPKAAQSALRAIQSRFDEIGHVPREAIRKVEDRMRAAEQRVREAVDAQWRAASAESNPFLAQLRERLAEAEQKLERAIKSGDAARIAKAEADVAQRKSLLPS